MSSERGARPQPALFCTCTGTRHASPYVAWFWHGQHLQALLCGSGGHVSTAWDERLRSTASGSKLSVDSTPLRSGSWVLAAHASMAQPCQWQSQAKLRDHAQVPSSLCACFPPSFVCLASIDSNVFTAEAASHCVLCSIKPMGHQSFVGPVGILLIIFICLCVCLVSRSWHS